MNRAQPPFLANFIALASQGISLSNYFAVTHPSEPNYVASVGGEYFGMNNDNLNRVPANVSSIVDLLESRCISWGEYQEHMPSTGFQGLEFLNPTTKANDYVRKHKWVDDDYYIQRHLNGLIDSWLGSPLIIYDSVANSPQRTANIKNFTLFEQDLANNELPQWFFITPNMSKDFLLFSPLCLFWVSPVST